MKCFPPSLSLSSISSVSRLKSLMCVSYFLLNKLIWELNFLFNLTKESTWKCHAFHDVSKCDFKSEFWPIERARDVKFLLIFKRFLRFLIFSKWSTLSKPSPNIVQVIASFPPPPSHIRLLSNDFVIKSSKIVSEKLCSWTIFWFLSFFLIWFAFRFLQFKMINKIWIVICWVNHTEENLE